MGKLKYPEMQNRDWLQNQYVVQGKTMAKIASEIGTSASVVLGALRKYLIPIRGHADHLKGKMFSEQHKKRISEALRGKAKPWHLGVGNPNWQGGRTKVIQMERTTVRYKAWKYFVFNRDRSCVECGSEKMLVAHHIKPYQEYPELRFDVSNGKVLCRSCHSSYHAKLSMQTGLIRRTPHVGNAEPAGAIA